MKTDIKDKASDSSAAHRRRSDIRPLKLIACHFAVRIDAALHDEFYDLRDAMASARIAKRDNPTAVITIADKRTGNLVFEAEA
jgi:hypothetical protein